MHYRELSLTTNTARLAELALTQCEVRVRGKREKPVDALDLANDPTIYPLLLYPTEEATELTSESQTRADQLGRRITLIVPDGNWRQGGKVHRRTPGLENVEAVKLPAGPLSEYLLRSEPRPECVSTFEAIARALGILEGKAIEDQLMEYFRAKVDRMLWARGSMRTDQVRGGIPQAAIDSFKAAGSRGGALSGRPPKV